MLSPISSLELLGAGRQGGGPPVVSREDTRAMARAFLESLGGMRNASELLAMSSSGNRLSAERQLERWKGGYTRMRADTYDKLWCMI